MEGRPTRQQIDKFKEQAQSVDQKSAESEITGAATNLLGTWKWVVAGGAAGGQGTNTLTITCNSNKLSGLLVCPGRKGKAESKPVMDLVWRGGQLSFRTEQWFSSGDMRLLSGADGESAGSGTLPSGQVTNAYSGELRGRSLVGEIIGASKDGGSFGLPWIAQRCEEKVVK